MCVCLDCDGLSQLRLMLCVQSQLDQTAYKCQSVTFRELSSALYAGLRVGQCQNGNPAQSVMSDGRTHVHISYASRWNLGHLTPSLCGCAAVTANITTHKL